MKPAAMKLTTYFAEDVDEASEFYLFASEKLRDSFVRRNGYTSWRFGRVVNEREITDGHA